MFFPDARTQSKQTAIQISGARVLTSDKCAAILNERKEKIKKQEEEKKEGNWEENKREKRKKNKVERRTIKEEDIAAEKRILADAKKAERKQRKLKYVNTKEEVRLREIDRIMVMQL